MAKSSFLCRLAATVGTVAAGLVILGILTGQGCPDDTGPTLPGGPTNGGANDGAITFTSGGVSIQAKSIESVGMTSTTITHAGQSYLEMQVTREGVRLIFPRENRIEDFIPFDPPLNQMPSDFATNRLAAYIAGQVYFSGGTGSLPDNPGCDWFPDTRCTLRCCADHDRCFAANNCGAGSWFPWVGSDACKNCNRLVRDCIIEACWSGSEGDASTDVCFDASCRASYTCPDNPFDCEACPSPCASPSTCGNGTCEVGETPENCVNDCDRGLAVNICCLENNGCPSETPETCPGDCCCCGRGEVCGAGNLCTRVSSAEAGASAGTPAPGEKLK